MHRFFIPKTTVNKGRFHANDPALCHQLSKVLKISPGEQSLLLTNNETEHLVKWNLISKSECTADILESKTTPDISSHTPLHLAVALLKNQNRWEWMLEKCTELGAASFTPLLTKRTEADQLRKLERLHRIIQEAAEQSGRTILPTLNDPIAFTDFLKQPGQKLIATLHESTPHYPLHTTHYELPATLLIGPEGGFTEKEVKTATDKGCLPLSLGSQTLRTETAAIVASAKILTAKL